MVHQENSIKLSLVSIRDKKTDNLTYFAVNDKHYNAMLACGGSNLDLELEYSWDWLGDVQITEEILNEEGWYYTEKENPETD